jgi:hypothetical protein
VAVQDHRALVHVDRFQLVPPGPLHCAWGLRTADVDPSCILFIEKEMCSGDHRNCLGLSTPGGTSAESVLLWLTGAIVKDPQHSGSGITRNDLRDPRSPKQVTCFTLPQYLYHGMWRVFLYRRPGFRCSRSTAVARSSRSLTVRLKSVANALPERRISNTSLGDRDFPPLMIVPRNLRTELSASEPEVKAD